MSLPKSHPRYESLRTRELIVKGVERGITSIHGLIAHGRGEAFDYLVGEKTNDFAKKSVKAAAAILLAAKNPVISVNGNAAALAPKELVKLSNSLNAALEVNIFHPSKQREIKIKNHLIKFGAKNILLPDKKHKIKFLESNRKYANPHGILKADIVFVPLEDGDRTEALIKNGKKVITIDLNPLSRTAQKATMSITDSVTRAVPLLIKTINQYKKYDKNRLRKIIKNYDNKKMLKEAIKQIRKL
ncbi:phosphopantothenate/pantothenate synthetase [Candidatus Woesearchaeota archaeon]|nr:phosphopantothenate/pantothenate synthetase [Candidatus Woesearchaeota archaeon]